MPLWMILLYIVGIAVVVVIVAIAIFYVVTFLTIAFSFFFGVRAIGRASRKAAPERDLKREIRITKKIDAEEDRKRTRQKSIDKEEDRVTKRKRKNRFWDAIYRDREPPQSPAESKAIELQQQTPKRIGLKRDGPKQHE